MERIEEKNAFGDLITFRRNPETGKPEYGAYLKCGDKYCRKYFPTKGAAKKVIKSERNPAFGG
jgi:hypothetical protein